MRKYPGVCLPERLTGAQAARRVDNSDLIL